MVSAVHRDRGKPLLPLGRASKGLHMVSAVHLIHMGLDICPDSASKGLHMVSAVHRKPWHIGASFSRGFKGAAHG